MDKKTGHVVCGALTTIMLIFSASALTDGRSFVDMKDTQKALKIEGEFSEANTIDSVLGYPYGMGVFKDQYGNDWDEGNNRAEYANNPTELARKPAHFVKLLDCEDHKERGMVFGACTFITTIAAAITVIANFSGTHTGQRKFGKIAVAGQVLLVLFTLIGFAIAGSFYNEEFNCKWDTNIIRMTIKDYFDLGYALPFHVVSFVVSIICLVILIISGTISAEEDNEDQDEDAEDADDAPDQ